MSAAAARGEPVLTSRRALYVGGLSESVNPTTLRAAMIPFGPVKSVDMPMDYQKGSHKGFGFVEYQHAEDAAEALYNMDGAELMGRTLNVSLADPNQSKLGSNQAVWSTDEWFQQQAGLGNKEDEAQRQAAEQDRSALKEQAPIQ